MNNKELAEKIINNIGGAGNIETYTHCITRLRFILKNKELVNENELRNISEIVGVVDRGGQYQLVIGTEVEKVFNEVQAILLDGYNKTEVVEAKEEQEKDSLMQKTMSYISASIAPTISVIVAAGLINAILSIAVQLGLDKTSGTYVALTAFTQIAFTYLPVWIAISAAKYLKTDSYIAAFISVASIVAFSNVDGMSIWGVTIPTINYGGSIVPVLVMVPILAYLDKFLTKYLHKNLIFMFKPLISSFIMINLVLFVFGPIGAFIGSVIVKLCFALMELGPISIGMLAALHPITVIFGMHSLFTPILVNELATGGVTYVLCRALAANFAMAGAALAVGIKAKKIKNKSNGISASITALLAATEPALYGVLIPLKRPLIGACLGAGVAGIFVGLFKVHSYSMGSFNIFTLAFTIGGDSLANFWIAVGCAILAFILGFIFTWILGFKEEKDEKEEK